MKYLVAIVAIAALLSRPTTAFVVHSCLPATQATSQCPASVRFAAVDRDTTATEGTVILKDREIERQRQKQALLGLLGGQPRSTSSPSDSEDDSVLNVNKSYTAYDPILVDPLTKEPLTITLKGPILGGGTSSSGIRLSLRSSADSNRVFEGRTDGYINLLEPAAAKTEKSNENSLDDDNDNGEEGKKRTSVSSSPLLSSLLTLTPPSAPFSPTSNNSNTSP